MAALIFATLLGAPAELPARALGPASPLDITFNPTGAIPGLANLPASLVDFRPEDAVVDSFGRVTIALSADTGPFDNDRIVRLTPSGVLDPTWGTAGVAALPAQPNGFSRITDIVLDSNGRLLIARQFGVDRLLSTGAVDPTFSPTTVEGASPVYRVDRLTVDSANRVVISGVGQFDNYLLARYTATGALDTTFGAAGAVNVNMRAEGTPLALSGDRIAVAGFNALSPAYSIVTRVTESGTIDTTFGSFGSVNIDGVAGPEIPLAMALDSTGRILVTGFDQLNTSDNRQSFVARLATNGAVDTAFLANSKATTQRFLVPRQVLVDGAGRVLLVGNLPNPGPQYIGPPAVAILSNLGQPETSVGWPSTTDGITVVSGLGSSPNSLILGAAIALGGAPVMWGAYGQMIARLTPAAPIVLSAGFNPVAPDRVLDTRSGIGAPTGKTAANTVLQLQVTGTPRVPTTGVTSVLINVTVVNPDNDGYATVYPCGTNPPTVSNLNFTRGQTIPNLVAVPIAPNGTICLTSSATTHFLGDIAGWYGG